MFKDEEPIPVTSDPYQIHDGLEESTEEDVTEESDAEEAEPEPKKTASAKAGAPARSEALCAYGRALRSLLPSEAWQSAAQEAQQLIQAAALRLSPDAKVRSFGSFAQGTCLAGSDLDLFIESAQLVPPPGKPRDWHRKQVTALQKLQGGLPLASFRVKETRYEWHVRVPILILFFRSHGMELQVDVSVGDSDHAAVKKGKVDRLIRGALAQASAIRLLSSPIRADSF
ncbi:unnamed protein product [Effrenium voratum]|nr:unnamed protein product [Effrenium voratum]